MKQEIYKGLLPADGIGFKGKAKPEFSIMGILRYIISVLTDSDIVHVGMVKNTLSFYQQLLRFELTEESIDIYARKHGYSGYVIFRNIDPDFKPDIAIQEANKLIGTWYDIFLLAGIGISKIFRWIPAERYNNPNLLTCNEVLLKLWGRKLVDPDDIMSLENVIIVKEVNFK